MRRIREVRRQRTRTNRPRPRRRRRKRRDSLLPNLSNLFHTSRRRRHLVHLPQSRSQLPRRHRSRRCSSSPGLAPALRRRVPRRSSRRRRSAHEPPRGDRSGGSSSFPDDNRSLETVAFPENGGSRRRRRGASALPDFPEEEEILHRLVLPRHFQRRR